MAVWRLQGQKGARPHERPNPSLSAIYLRSAHRPAGLSAQFESTVIGSLWLPPPWDKYTSLPVCEAEKTPNTGGEPVERRTPFAMGPGGPVIARFFKSNGSAINVWFCMKSKRPWQ